MNFDQKIRVVIVAITALCASVPAKAQVEMLMIGLCKKVSDDASRLKCFDAIGTAAEPSKQERDSPKVQEWTIADSKSPVDDSPQVSARLLSQDGDSMLVLRCAERKTEVAVIPKGLFAYERGSVLIRLNDQPAASATWSASDHNKALFAPNGVAFIRMLPDNGDLFIRSTGHNGNRAADAMFKLGAVSAVRDRISAACKWQSISTSKASTKDKDTSPASAARP